MIDDIQLIRELLRKLIYFSRDPQASLRRRRRGPTSFSGPPLLVGLHSVRSQKKMVVAGLPKSGVGGDTTRSRELVRSITRLSFTSSSVVCGADTWTSASATARTRVWAMFIASLLLKRYWPTRSSRPEPEGEYPSTNRAISPCSVTPVAHVSSNKRLTHPAQLRAQPSKTFPAIVQPFPAGRPRTLIVNA